MTDNMLDINIDNSEFLEKIHNNGDRRMGLDRRFFSYSLHIPERRNGEDRRTGEDRRKLPRMKIKY